MAVEYLDEGVNNFSVGSWKTVSGGAGSGIANGATLVVRGGGASVTSDVDWSPATKVAMTTGITWMKFAERFSGNIGTASAPFKVDADVADAEYASNEGSPSGRIEHYGPGTVYITAGGNSTKISNYFQFGVGRSVFIGGTFAYTSMKQGTLQVEEAATVTKADLFGGGAIIASNSSAGTTLNVHGGAHTIQRPFTTINVYVGSLTVNVFNALAASTINIYGGTVTLLGHGNTSITAITQYGGFLDVSALRVDTIVTTWTRYQNGQVSARPMGADLTITTQIRKDPTIQAF